MNGDEQESIVVIADWRDKQRKKAVKNWFNFCKAVTGVAQAARHSKQLGVENLLVTYPPKVSISKLVNSLKGISSLLIR